MSQHLQFIPYFKGLNKCTLICFIDSGLGLKYKDFEFSILINLSFIFQHNTCFFVNLIFYRYFL